MLRRMIEFSMRRCMIAVVPAQVVETLWPEGVETHFLFPYTWVHELAPSYDLKEKAISGLIPKCSGSRDGPLLEKGRI